MSEKSQRVPGSGASRVRGVSKNAGAPRNAANNNTPGSPANEYDSWEPINLPGQDIEQDADKKAPGAKKAAPGKPSPAGGLAVSSEAWKTLSENILNPKDGTKKIETNPAGEKKVKSFLREAMKDPQLIELRNKVAAAKLAYETQEGGWRYGMRKGLQAVAGTANVLNKVVNGKAAKNIQYKDKKLEKLQQEMEAAEEAWEKKVGEKTEAAYQMAVASSKGQLKGVENLGSRAGRAATSSEDRIINRYRGIIAHAMIKGEISVMAAKKMELLKAQEDAASPYTKKLKAAWKWYATMPTHKKIFLTTVGVTGVVALFGGAGATGVAGYAAWRAARAGIGAYGGLWAAKGAGKVADKINAKGKNKRETVTAAAANTGAQEFKRADAGERVAKAQQLMREYRKHINTNAAADRTDARRKMLIQAAAAGAVGVGVYTGINSNPPSILGGSMSAQAQPVTGGVGGGAGTPPGGGAGTPPGGIAGGPIPAPSAANPMLADDDMMRGSQNTPKISPIAKDPMLADDDVMRGSLNTPKAPPAGDPMIADDDVMRGSLKTPKIPRVGGNPMIADDDVMRGSLKTSRVPGGMLDDEVLRGADRVPKMPPPPMPRGGTILGAPGEQDNVTGVDNAVRQNWVFNKGGRAPIVNSDPVPTAPRPTIGAPGAQDDATGVDNAARQHWVFNKGGAAPSVVDVDPIPPTAPRPTVPTPVEPTAPKPPTTPSEPTRPSTPEPAASRPLFTETSVVQKGSNLSYILKDGLQKSGHLQGLSPRQADVLVGLYVDHLKHLSLAERSAMGFRNPNDIAFMHPGDKLNLRGLNNEDLYNKLVGDVKRVPDTASRVSRPTRPAAPTPTQEIVPPGPSGAEIDQLARNINNDQISNIFRTRRGFIGPWTDGAKEYNAQASWMRADNFVASGQGSTPGLGPVKAEQLRILLQQAERSGVSLKGTTIKSALEQAARIEATKILTNK